MVPVTLRQDHTFPNPYERTAEEGACTDSELTTSGHLEIVEEESKKEKKDEPKVTPKITPLPLLMEPDPKAEMRKWLMHPDLETKPEAKIAYRYLSKENVKVGQWILTNDNAIWYRSTKDKIDCISSNVLGGQSLEAVKECNHHSLKHLTTVVEDYGQEAYRDIVQFRSLMLREIEKKVDQTRREPKFQEFKAELTLSELCRLGSNKLFLKKQFEILQTLSAKHFLPENGFVPARPFTYCMDKHSIKSETIMHRHERIASWDHSQVKDLHGEIFPWDGCEVVDVDITHNEKGEEVEVVKRPMKMIIGEGPLSPSEATIKLQKYFESRQLKFPGSDPKEQEEFLGRARELLQFPLQGEFNQGFVATRYPGGASCLLRLAKEKKAAAIISLGNYFERKKLKYFPFFETPFSYEVEPGRIVKWNPMADKHFKEEVGSPGGLPIARRSFKVVRNEDGLAPNPLGPAEHELSLIHHLHFPEWPEHKPPTEKEFNTLNQTIAELRHAGESGPLIIHCGGGVGRSAIFAAAQLMLQRIHKQSTASIDLTKVKVCPIEIALILRWSRGINALETQQHFEAFIEMVANQFRAHFRPKFSLDSSGDFGSEIREHRFEDVTEQVRHNPSLLRGSFIQDGKGNLCYLEDEKPVIVKDNPKAVAHLTLRRLRGQRKMSLKDVLNEVEQIK